MPQANSRLLGRKVTLDQTAYEINEKWTEHMKAGGTIEAVHYDKDSRSFNGYYVLVRNHDGKTLELPLKYLILEEAKAC